MKLRTKISALLATAGLVGVLASAPAHAVYSTLGVTWNPAVAADFTLEPSTPFSYFTHAAPSTVTNAFDPRPSSNLFVNGDVVQGFGQFSPPGINSSGGGSLSAGTQLTFVYNGLTLTNASNNLVTVTALLTTGGSIDIYSTNGGGRTMDTAATAYNLAKSNPNFQTLNDTANDGTLFLRLKPRANGVNVGQSTSEVSVTQVFSNVFAFTANWLFDIDTTVGDATAIAALNTNSKALGTDFQIGFTTQFDTSKGIDKNWGVLGGNITGLSAPQIPEPGSLALIGLALAGLGFARRRRA